MPRGHSRDELIRRSSAFTRAIAAVSSAVGVVVAVSPASAFAQPVEPTATDPFATGAAQAVAPGPSEVSVPPSEDADPAAVAACGQFAAVLQGTSLYYGYFAEALETYEDPDYSDPSISNANGLGRTALRQGAGLALSASNTPGLAPDIAGPMRSWSLGATKLLLKMGLRTSGETLNLSVADLNAHATAVQTACAAAGTHA
ncbi:hypothetical protein [Mycobacterium sp. 236(2023)]|uniref:hypothetical protein n=1 Tax=Mycobacterium sp. 236(2023) TaxID=3038163 RepID=UPI002414E29E|nr:hypothetical protein [Mycobacterium sp. 236(2023)]MDG4665674.1 hypothetical protein [Mycobacterium sp. 236(2023)]